MPDSERGAKWRLSQQDARCTFVPNANWIRTLAGTAGHIFLDIRPRFSYQLKISPAYRTAAGDTGRRGESGSRGRGLVTSVPGRLRGSTPGRQDDRSAGKPAGLGQEGAGNTRW